MVTIGIIAVILIVLASIFESTMDKINFHFEKSIFSDKKNQLFWNPSLSWKNKWKEDLKTEKFWGSSTIFVFTTDAWHLFKFLRNTSLFIGLPLLYFLPINIILSILISRFLYGIFFTYFFDVKFVKK